MDTVNGNRNGVSKNEVSPIPIAIIGMSCRFSGGATDPEKLWKLCAEGRSAWSKIPSSRFYQEGFYHPNGERIGTVSLDQRIRLVFVIVTDHYVLRSPM